MPTGSERTFSVGETSTPMNPSLKDIFNALIARMDEIDQRLQEFKDQASANCRNLATQIDSLKLTRGKPQIT